MTIKIDENFVSTPTEEAKSIAQERFGLRNGQYFGNPAHANLFWTLDGVTIGFGDLRLEDIHRIQQALGKKEVFLGWNEHHGTVRQQTNHPVIKILKYGFSYPHRDDRILR